MQLSLIVAIADNNVIGKQGSLMPWHLPADFAHFKRLTVGHPIIMGRTTHETIGRPLPGRQNIIVTHELDYQAEGCTVVHSIDEALQAAGSATEVFVIGGAAIFEQTIARADTIYLTRVHASPEGDTFFRYNLTDWSETDVEPHSADERNQYAYTFSKLTRR